MKLAPILALGAAFLVGTGIYVVLDDGDQRRAGDPSSKKDDRPSRKGGDAAPAGDLEARVAALEDEVARLRRQLRASRVMGSPTWTPPPGRDEDPGEPLASATAQSAGEAVQAERERQQAEEAERRRERWEQRTKAALDVLTNKAGIDASQRDKIATLWTEERDKMAALWTEARDGGHERKETRAEARELRRTTDGQARELLDGKQFAVYEKVRQRSSSGGGKKKSE